MADSRYTQVSVKGLAQARMQFQRLPQVTRTHLNEATEATATRILAGARQRVAPHRRFGFLERYLAQTMNERTGEARVGLPRRAAVIPAGALPTARITKVIRRKGASTFDVYGEGSARSARVIYPSRYAHLVEFGHARGRGTSSAPAYPFMIPSAEASRSYYLQACHEAGRRTERDFSVSRLL